MFKAQRSLNSILQVFDKAAAQLEEYISQKDEEALDNAAKAREHQELASGAIKDREKANSKLLQIRNLTST